MAAQYGGDRSFDRHALQETLADLVRAADESVDAPDPAGDVVDEPAAPAPRPRIPTVRAPGQQAPASVAPEDPAPAVAGAGAAGAPRPPAPRPAAAPQPPAAAPHPSSPMTAQDAGPAPVPHPDGVRPPSSGRPRLPFSPGPAPSPQGGPAGTVRPGAGGMGGSGVRAPSFGGGLTPGSDDDAVMAPRGINASAGLPGLGGRITRDQGDNLARLAPAPVEQSTIALRRRKPAADPGAGHEGGPGAGGAGAPGQGSHGGQGGQGGHGGPGGHAPAAPAARPQVAVEPWVPSYDDILPQRSARSGRSFRLRK